MTPPILGFFGEYRFLSNFHFADVSYEGIVYPTNEHAYQAAKSASKADRLEIATLRLPKEARRAGQKLELVPDWESKKYDVMLSLTRQKFTIHRDLREHLLATGDAYLEETNTWGDVGVCRGQGQNNLGKILMQVRAELLDK